jgi:hypothetical protein
VSSSVTPWVFVMKALVPNIVVDGCVDAGLVIAQLNGEQLVHHGGLFLAWCHIGYHPSTVQNREQTECMLGSH